VKLYALLFAGWSAIAACSAHAAFFTDEEAHNQIRQLKERVSNLEGIGKQQTEIIKHQDETIKQEIETRKQQTREILDLQAQIDTLRGLRGQYEVLAHNLQEAEKRQRDSYSDLDARVLRLDKREPAAIPRPIKR
jgi:chromosome segregation ATPase